METIKNTTPKKSLFKKWWFWLAVILVLGVIGKMGEKKDAANTLKGNMPEQQGAVKHYKLGDEITFEDSKWVLMQVKDLGTTAQSNNMFQKDAVTSGRFILVAFSVENLTRKEERIVAHPKLRDSKGREYLTYDSQSFYVPKDAEVLTLSSLPAGMKKTFWAVYEVPADAIDLQFNARALSAFGDDIWVALGL